MKDTMQQGESRETVLDRDQMMELWSTFDDMQAEASITRDATEYLESLLVGTYHHEPLDKRELAGMSMLLEGIVGKMHIIEDMASSGMGILRRSEGRQAQEPVCE